MNPGGNLRRTPAQVKNLVERASWIEPWRLGAVASTDGRVELTGSAITIKMRWIQQSGMF